MAKLEKRPRYPDGVPLYFGNDNDVSIQWTGSVWAFDGDIQAGLNHGLAINGASSPAAQGISASGSTTIITAAAIGGLVQLRDFNGNVWIAAQGTGTEISNLAQTSGTPSVLTLSGAAHTGLDAGIAATDVTFNLGRTVQHAGGNITNYPAVQFNAPTYAFTSGSTIDNAATIYIAGSPGAGTNATITNSYALWLNGGLRVDGDIDLSNANVNIALDTTTGTQIGTAVAQKLAFWGGTPIVRPSSSGETSGVTAGSGTAVKDDDTFTGNVGSTAYTISDIVKHLKNLNLIKP